VAIGVIVILSSTLVSGNYARDYFSGSFSLVGYFGSKNQVGLIASIGLIFAVSYLKASDRPFIRWLLSILTITLSFISLYLCNSATSVASLLIACLSVICVHFIRKMPKVYHRPTLAVAPILLISILLLGAILDWDKAVLDLFGKDSTLTGRTDLWSEGIRIGAENPIWGNGFSAFWVYGNNEAEKLWYAFGITGRGGFHFHNTFIQAFVDLGLVGALFMVLMYCNTIWAGLSYVISCRLDAVGILSIALSVMFFVRAFVEVDVFTAFSVGQLLFFTIVPYLNKGTATKSVF
jgi:exopolysaccharide production protein ExoQ